MLVFAYLNSLRGWIVAIAIKTDETKQKSFELFKRIFSSSMGLMDWSNTGVRTAGGSSINCLANLVVTFAKTYRVGPTVRALDRSLAPKGCMRSPGAGCG